MINHNFSFGYIGHAEYKVSCWLPRLLARLLFEARPRPAISLVSGCVRAGARGCAEAGVSRNQRHTGQSRVLRTARR